MWPLRAEKCACLLPHHCQRLPLLTNRCPHNAQAIGEAIKLLGLCASAGELVSGGHLYRAHQALARIRTEHFREWDVSAEKARCGHTATWQSTKDHADRTASASNGWLLLGGQCVGNMLRLAAVNVALGSRHCL